MKKSNIKILLVDDEPDILEIVGYNLESEGYNVLKAENGIEALEIAKKINVYPGLINAVLKKICDEKTKLKQIKVFFRDFPEWFKKYAENLDIRKKIQFEDNYYKTPSFFKPNR